MKQTKIQKVEKQVIVQILDEMFYLPEELQQKIDAYWKELIRKNPRFTRGKVYCVKEVVEEKENIRILLTYSDYAHYMYDMHNELEEQYKCKNCWAATLIETKDQYYIVGKTQEGTSAPNLLQLSGGNIDEEDINQNIVDMRHCAKRELKEETGIDMEKEELSFLDTYVSYEIDKNPIGVIFKVKLNQTEKELMEQYKTYRQYLEENNLEIEFSDLFSIQKENVEDFFKTIETPWEDTIYPLLKEDSK